MRTGRPLPSIRKRIRSWPTASCSPTSRQPSCRWRSATSCSDFRDSMRTIDKRIEAKLAAPLIKRAPTLTLAFDDRCKSRLAATLDNGEEVALVLPRGTVLRDGDMLVADDGGLVRVIAHRRMCWLYTPTILLRSRAPRTTWATGTRRWKWPRDS